MKVTVQKSFEKDISKIVEKNIAQKVLTIIEQLELAQTLLEIPHVKKLETKGNYYRIRIGNYRLGLKVEKDTVYLLRIMNREDIYKYFP
jgi:mRNA interferase RelE/StbE